MKACETMCGYNLSKLTVEHSANSQVGLTKRQNQLVQSIYHPEHNPFYSMRLNAALSARISDPKHPNTQCGEPNPYPGISVIGYQARYTVPGGNGYFLTNITELKGMDVGREKPLLNFKKKGMKFQSLHEKFSVDKLRHYLSKRSMKAMEGWRVVFNEERKCFDLKELSLTEIEQIIRNRHRVPDRTQIQKHLKWFVKELLAVKDRNQYQRLNPNFDRQRRSRFDLKKRRPMSRENYQYASFPEYQSFETAHRKKRKKEKGDPGIEGKNEYTLGSNAPAHPGTVHGHGHCGLRIAGTGRA